MNLISKIKERMDQLQDWMEEDYNMEDPDTVYEHTLTVSKFWSVLSEEDKDYIQGIQFAIESNSQVSWRRL
jgi:hypothetical protein